MDESFPTWPGAFHPLPEVKSRKPSKVQKSHVSIMAGLHEKRMKKTNEFDDDFFMQREEDMLLFPFAFHPSYNLLVRCDALELWTRSALGL